jgi:hypothetical protein
MTRPLTLARIALAILSAVPPSLSAQIFYPPNVYPRLPGPRPFNPPSDPIRYPIEIGEYATVGGASAAVPSTSSPYAIGTVGIYAQWNRYGLCPGLDLRIQGNASQLHGYLVGPRVAYQPRGRQNPLRLYAEALFGKNESPYNRAIVGVLDPAFNSYTGTTRAVAIGLDFHSDSAFAWRVIEFTKGDFTGIPNSHPQTITTGIVLHLP